MFALQLWEIVVLGVWAVVIALVVWIAYLVIRAGVAAGIERAARRGHVLVQTRPCATPPDA